MRTFTALTLAVSLASLTACEGPNLFAGAGVTPVDEPDLFTAVDFVIENEAGDSIDVVADGGLFELALDRDAATFGSDFRFDGRTVDLDGTFVLDGSDLIFSDDPFIDDEVIAQRAFEIDDRGDVIVLRDPNAVWDVDNDGFEEVVDVRIRLERTD